MRHKKEHECGEGAKVAVAASVRAHLFDMVFRFLPNFIMQIVYPIRQQQLHTICVYGKFSKLDNTATRSSRQPITHTAEPDLLLFIQPNCKMKNASETKNRVDIFISYKDCNECNFTPQQLLTFSQYSG